MIESDQSVDAGPAAGPDSDAAPSGLWGNFDGQYPFSGRWHEVPSSAGPAVRMHYLDEGPPDAPPLLFVHGNPTWSFAWRNLIRGLSNRYRCVAVDHVGCGRSDKPADGAYRLGWHRNNLQSLVETLALEDITLIAHDWGGAIGCAAAGRTRDRFRRLVLMNTGAFRSKRMPFRIGVCRWPVVGPFAVRGFNAFAGAAVTMAVEKPMPPAVKRGYLAPYDSWANRVAVQRFVEDIPMRMGHPSFDDLVECEKNLARLKDKPVLLPWGERDWCFTTAFRDEFLSRFPHAESVPFPDAGHYLFEDEADGLLAAIDGFLERT